MSPMRVLRLVLPVALLIAAAPPRSAPMVFEVDGAKKTPISPFIYGHNGPDWKSTGTMFTLARSGGNRMTAYNWETNASNAGSDWQHQNDAFLGGGDVPGEVVRGTVAAAHASGAACVVTVPIIGAVAADKNGGGDVNKTPDYLTQRFLPSLPSKNAPFADPPDLKDGKVYQDEFVAWLEKTFPGARKDERRTIFYDLDNEPDLWSGTHARIHPKKVGYEELARLNSTYAAAIKKVAPGALVFGFVSYGWLGFATLQDAPDAQGRNFIDYYLQEMKKAETEAGKRLVDVLDLHWYPEARGGNKRVMEDDAAAPVAAARIQAPRSLWDPGYKEDSWIAKSSTRGPVRLLPRVREQIEKNYPGTKLAITEYYYGGGADISGALAQADVLGIFGREGVFAAALWHLGKTNDRFIRASFAMYRDCDGKGGAFGPTGLAVSGGDPASASVYASQDSPKRMVLVAINKTPEALPLKITFKGCPAFSRVTAYRLTAAEPKPVPQDGIKPVGGAIETELPPLSITTLVLTP
jgi:hypothetical protein